MFDYSKLLGRIKEMRYTQGRIAEAAGMSENSFTNKIKRRSPFSALEIDAICKLLCIPANEIGIYFFTPLVEESKLTKGSCVKRG